MGQNTILIVEDEEVLSRMIKSNLEKENFNVIIAADGVEGLDKAREGNVDLIVLDIILPKIDGYALCRLLKFDDKYKKIPIIILSSKAEEKDRQMSLELGADVYIPKPYEPNVLLSKIKELLSIQ